MQENFKYYVDEFKKGIHDDTVGLWEIIGCVEQHFSPENDDALKVTTLEMIRAMLNEGFIAGDSEYLPTGYVAWEDQNVEHVISRISEEWDKLGRVPNIGDIVYFDLPGYKPASN